MGSTVPSSAASALLLFAIALALAGASLPAVAIVGGLGVAWEAYLMYLAGSR